MRRLELPPAQRQRRLRRRDGHYHPDRYWQEFDLCCEVHGTPHLNVGHWDSGVTRQNEISIAGPRLLVFTSYAIRRLSDLVSDQIMRFLRTRDRVA